MSDTEILHLHLHDSTSRKDFYRKHLLLKKIITSGSDTCLLGEVDVDGHVRITWKKEDGTIGVSTAFTPTDVIGYINEGIWVIQKDDYFKTCVLEDGTRVLMIEPYVSVDKFDMSRLHLHDYSIIIVGHVVYKNESRISEVELHELCKRLRF